MRLGMAVLFAIVSIAARAESPLLDEAALKTFLPKNEIKDFMRMEHDSPKTVKDMTTAMVQYIKMPSESNPQVQTFVVTIIDSIKYRSKIDSQIKPESKDDEVCKVKDKYPGRRNNKTSAAGGEKTCSITFIVANRFVVSVFAAGSNDFAAAEKFIDQIDLKGLEEKAK